MEYRLNGKPLNECSYDELSNEWSAGQYLDSSEGLSKEQMQRLLAVEHEMCSRPDEGERE